jgi:putative transposase
MLKDLSANFEVSFLCDLFNFKRNSFYYRSIRKPRCSKYDQIVIEVFKKSRSIYGSRKVEAQRLREGYIVSRRKVLAVMTFYGLVSKYMFARKFKVKTVGQWVSVGNLVNRHFSGLSPFEVVVADVTYVYFGKKLYYLCIIMDIATRMIVGHSVDIEIGSKLVASALSSMNLDLSKVKIFHTDRGSEFNNHRINELMSSFGIIRSLSGVSTPLDNAVIESLNNIVKIEWQFGLSIRSLSGFRASWNEYVDWYNNSRIHGSLDYLTPAEYLLTFASAS